MAAPSGLCLAVDVEVAVAGDLAAADAGRRLSSPAIVAVTTVPGSTTPWLSGASPTVGGAQQLA